VSIGGVKLTWDRVAPALVQSSRSLPVANVSDSMARICALSTRMRPMHRSGNLAGPALTVRTRPGDNLMLRKAIDMAQSGDVIVVDAAEAFWNGTFQLSPEA
jgi:regulator of RNase E activity RraA